MSHKENRKIQRGGNAGTTVGGTISAIIWVVSWFYSMFLVFNLGQRPAGTVLLHVLIACCCPVCYVLLHNFFC